MVDTIYFNGKIVTVDRYFSIAQAVAVCGDRFHAFGTDNKILSLAGPGTRKVDLKGRMAVPGLTDAHAHPENASLSELEYPLPDLACLDDVLEWIRRETKARPAGEWIILPAFFAVRLAELRPPTISELDSVAPDHPVFLDGSFGGVINSAAARASGITPESSHSGLLKDPATGAITGKLRYTAYNLLKLRPRKKYTTARRAQALARMFRLYNQVGFTSVTSGELSADDVELYRYMKENGLLTIRVFMNIRANFPFKYVPLSRVREALDKLPFRTGDGDEWVRTGALKTYIDGGILTGTAYLRKPWGARAGRIFGFDDPEYRGSCRFTVDQFARLAQAGAEKGWKVTAHSAGGAGMDLMLDAYEKVSRLIDIRPLRFAITHGNFFTPEAVARCRALEVIADLQPAWFYKDADTMLHLLGKETIRTFHPYRSLIDGGVVLSAGSDHMVKMDSRDSINPYNPWQAIWSAVTRKTARGTAIMPEEAVSREDALRMYTINNAYASFEEKLKGSIEPGKLADMVVLEQDYLTCPEEEIKDIEVRMTIVGGRVVFKR